MSLKQHYIDRFRQFGAQHKAVQYSSQKTQYARFEILSEPIKRHDSVLDLGCGLGDMLTFLRQKKDFQGSYLGLDFVPDFIKHAKKTFETDSKAEFQIFDIINDSIPENYDVVVLSGVFNNLMDDNWRFLTSTLKKMFAYTNRLVSFNSLSTYVDYRDDGLYYVDPLQVVDFCKTNISPLVTLRHDYLIKENSIPFEFTVYIYK